MAGADGESRRRGHSGRTESAGRQLASYAGVFEGTGTLTEGEKTVPLNLRHENTTFADGWGLTVNEKVDMAGLGTYLSQNLFGFDPGSGLVHLFTVSNGADTHDHMGTWVDNTHLVLRYSGIVDGKPAVEEIPISFDTPDQYSFVSTPTVGGAVTCVMKGMLRRQTSMARK